MVVPFTGVHLAPSEIIGGGDGALIRVAVIVSKTDVGGFLGGILSAVDVRLVQTRDRFLFHITGWKRARVQRLGNRLWASVSFRASDPSVPLRQVMWVLVTAEMHPSRLQIIPFGERSTNNAKTTHHGATIFCRRLHIHSRVSGIALTSVRRRSSHQRVHQQCIGCHVVRAWHFATWLAFLLIQNNLLYAEVDKNSRTLTSFGGAKNISNIIMDSRRFVMWFSDQ